MFIDSSVYKVLRSSGAKCMVRRIHLPVHCAPLERQTVVGREVYKHLAPPEPEHHLERSADFAALPFDTYTVWSCAEFAGAGCRS